ncbi:hypothetical protein O3P69_020639 [Scylla paramamosain]|uniref:Uncharacterized protein n=1 Tax=Scylla paramamosain TaxID=85552 RepID=A0AAW0TMP1_SCYPA
MFENLVSDAFDRFYRKESFVSIVNATKKLMEMSEPMPNGRLSADLGEACDIRRGEGNCDDRDRNNCSFDIARDMLDYFSVSPMGLVFTVITDVEGRERVMSIGDMALLAIWIKVKRSVSEQQYHFSDDAKYFGLTGEIITADSNASGISDDAIVFSSVKNDKLVLLDYGHEASRRYLRKRSERISGPLTSFIGRNLITPNKMEQKKDRGRCCQSLEWSNVSDALLYSRVVYAPMGSCTYAATTAAGEENRLVLLVNDPLGEGRVSIDYSYSNDAITVNVGPIDNISQEHFRNKRIKTTTTDFSSSKNILTYALMDFNTDLEDGDEQRESTLLHMLEYNTNWYNVAPASMMTLGMSKCRISGDDNTDMGKMDPVFVYTPRRHMALGLRTATGLSMEKSHRDLTVKLNSNHMSVIFYKYNTNIDTNSREFEGDVVIIQLSNGYVVRDQKGKRDVVKSQTTPATPVETGSELGCMCGCNRKVPGKPRARARASDHHRLLI